MEFQTFIELSVDLTAFDQVDLRGTGFAEEYLATAKKVVGKMGFKTNLEYKEYLRNNKYMIDGVRFSAAPNMTDKYKKDWISWGDYLGTGIDAVFKRKFTSFSKARSFARALKLSGESQWRLYCVNKLPNYDPKPSLIPSNPQRTYLDNWISWSDWLGNSL